jgi:hypothetical protein
MDGESSFVLFKWPNMAPADDEERKGFGYDCRLEGLMSVVLVIS